MDVARLTVIAHAIASVSESVDDAAGLLAIGDAESRWCERVHAGRARGGDGVGLWQLERGSHRAPPFAGLCVADTVHAAGEALWIWRHSYQCGGALSSRFESYAGLRCDVAWRGAARRVAFYTWATWRLTGEIS